MSLEPRSSFVPPCTGLFEWLESFFIAVHVLPWWTILLELYRRWIVLNMELLAWYTLIKIIKIESLLYRILDDAIQMTRIQSKPDPNPAQAARVWAKPDSNTTQTWPKLALGKPEANSKVLKSFFFSRIQIFWKKKQVAQMWKNCKMKN